jgi:hypothetical protein
MITNDEEVSILIGAADRVFRVVMIDKTKKGRRKAGSSANAG